MTETGGAPVSTHVGHGLAQPSDGDEPGLYTFFPSPFLDPEPQWQDRAKCKGEGVDAFFFGRGQSVAVV